MCVAFACEEERIVMNDVVQVDVDINASRQPILFTFAEVLENKIFSIFFAILVQFGIVEFEISTWIRHYISADRSTTPYTVPHLLAQVRCVAVVCL